MRTLVRCLYCLVGLLFFVACGKGDEGQESLSVTPSVVETPAEMTSLSVKVEADCRWTAVSQVDWIVLSNSKGSGDADVTLRIMKNPYKENRNAMVVFKTEKGLEQSVTVNQSAAESGKDKNVAEFRLGSYNLRMGHLDTDDDNKWSARKSRLMESILDNAFDIAGVQEVNTQMQNDLRTELGKDYTFWFFSPYAQSGVGDKAHGIMFRTSMFEISDKHFFWASDTPDVCSVNDTGASGSFRRGGCCAVLTHKGTGIRLFLICTHACLNKEPNSRYAPVYRQMEEKYNTEGLPSFMVGDMNAGPDADASKTFREYWSDVYRTIDPSLRTGLQNTYNGYKYPSGNSRIDYIYYRGKGVEPMTYNCNGSLYAGKYASDHFPVSADIKITK